MMYKTSNYISRKTEFKSDKKKTENCSPSPTVPCSCISTGAVVSPYLYLHWGCGISVPVSPLGLWYLRTCVSVGAVLCRLSGSLYGGVRVLAGLLLARGRRRGGALGARRLLRVSGHLHTQLLFLIHLYTWRGGGGGGGSVAFEDTCESVHTSMAKFVL